MPGHLGIRITEASKDKLVGEMDADARHLNAGGSVHGGALAAFADDLGGALASLNAPKGFRTTTIESKTNIFRACAPGRLMGVALPVHVGRRTIVLQTSIYRADGKLAAMMIQTQMVVPREPQRTDDTARQKAGARQQSSPPAEAVPSGNQARTSYLPLTPLSPTHLQERRPMPVYRCYFLDDEDHIKAYESIEADALSEALERALAMLKARPQHHKVELWEGAKRRYPASEPADTCRSYSSWS